MENEHLSDWGKKCNCGRKRKRKRKFGHAITKIMETYNILLKLHRYKKINTSN